MATAGRRAVRETEMRAVLGRWQRSGLPLSRFGEREGIAAKTMYRWRRRLGVGADQVRRGRPVASVGAQRAPAQSASMFTEVSAALRSAYCGDHSRWCSAAARWCGCPSTSTRARYACCSRRCANAEPAAVGAGVCLHGADRHEEVVRRFVRAGGVGVEAGPVLRPSLRLPEPATRQGEDPVLGPLGILPDVQAARGGHVRDARARRDRLARADDGARRAGGGARCGSGGATSARTYGFFIVLHFVRATIFIVADAVLYTVALSSWWC